MFPIIILILSAISATLGSDPPSCGGLDPVDVCSFDVSKVKVPFNEFQLGRFCIRMQAYYTCVEQHKDEFKDEFCGIGLFLKNAESLIQKLCDTDTQLHKKYLPQAACLSSVQFYFKDCYKSAKTVADLYFQTAGTKKYGENLKTCIIGAQYIYNVGNMVLSECGDDASDLFWDMVNESRFHSLYCISEGEYDQASEAISVILRDILLRKVSSKDVFVESPKKKTEMLVKQQKRQMERLEEKNKEELEKQNASHQRPAE